MTKLYLSLALHNHQPVGNFAWVFEEAYQKAYLPMLEALERHPGVRLAVHNTGPLLDWLLPAHPEYIARLAALAAAGQVEIMTGGYYEPILVSLPDHDKLSQLRKLTDTVRTHFGYEATGAWLAERVWEPHLPKPLHEAGVQFIVVDDTHLRYAGKTDDEMFGYYITEEQGHPLKVFASAKHLRYSVPWSPVADVIAWLRQVADSDILPDLYRRRPKVAVMGDDGEKFGLWPGTYRHCWTNGWVDEFFAALEANNDWLETVPPGEFAARQPALGQVYMTAASYDEMTEWALPAEMSASITQVKHELQAARRDDVLRFLKGGLWRGFMAKYAEVNQMHKKALWVSQKVQAMPPGDARQRAQEALWAAQCNCGYWHGLFGGIYLFHIRGINYRNLITAETLADNEAYGSGWVHWFQTDFDRDGVEELILTNERQWLCFDLDNGGKLVEWDWRDAPYNLLNSMSRYYEWYHDEIRSAAADGRIHLKPASDDEELTNVHERGVLVKELGLEKKLFRDGYRRGGLHDRFLPVDASLEDFAAARLAEWGDFLESSYTAQVGSDADGLTATLSRRGQVNGTAVTVQKTVRLDADSNVLHVRYQLRNVDDQPLRCRFGVENNWGLEGGQDPLTYFLGLEDAAAARQYPGQAGAASNISAFALVSDIITVRSRVDLALSQPAAAWFYPFESVTNSEAGYEANYQGTSILTHWPLSLAPGETWQVQLHFTLNVT